jgi:hypothetical protein
MGLLWILPALVSYATLEQSLQQQQVCFVGPAQPSPQARRQWTREDLQQRRDFLQPLYGMYQVIVPEDVSLVVGVATTTKSATSVDRKSSSSAATSTTTTNSNNKNNNHQAALLKLYQTPSSSSSSTTNPQLPQPLVPHVAGHFWSVTTLAATLTLRRRRKATTITSSTTSTSSPTTQPMVRRPHVLLWDQQEQKSADRARKQASANNRWCLVPNVTLLQVFAVKQRQERYHQKQLQLQQQLQATKPKRQFKNRAQSSSRTGATAAATMASANPHRRLQQQEEQQQQLPPPQELATSNQSSSSSSHAMDASFLNQVRHHPTNRTAAAFQQQVHEPLQKRPYQKKQHHQQQHPIKEQMTDDIMVHPPPPPPHELTRYQICSKMEPSLLLSRLPPFEWPMKAPPNGIWNQYEVVFPKKSKTTSDGTTTTTTVRTRMSGGITAATSAIADDDVAMALPYLIPSHQPMQIQVSCFMKDMSTIMEEALLSAGTSSSSSSKSTLRATTFLPLAETPVTWLLILMLIWQQCTYRRHKRRWSRKSKRDDHHDGAAAAGGGGANHNADQASLSTTPTTALRAQRRRKNRFGWQSRHEQHHSTFTTNNNNRSRSPLQNHHYLVNANSRREELPSSNNEQPSPVDSLVVAMYEQWIHNSWKELLWNAVWLYLVASKLEREYFGGLILLAVYVTLGWSLAILRLIMVNCLWNNHYVYNRLYGKDHHDDDDDTISEQQQDGQSMSSWTRRSKALKQQQQQSSLEPPVDHAAFTEMGQIGIVLGLIVILAQQQSYFSMLGIWTMETFPVITAGSYVPGLDLNLLPAIVIAPYVLLMFPSGKDYITLFLGTLIPSIGMGWILSWNFMIHIVAAPQWIIPVTLLVHLVLVRWSPKLACCYQDDMDDLERAGSHHADEFQPLFLKGLHHHLDARGPSDDQSGQWTLPGGSIRSGSKYQKLSKDDSSIVSESISQDGEPLPKWRMPWSEFLALGTWMLTGCVLTVLPWFWSIQLDVGLLVGHVATLVLFVPVLYYCGGAKRGATISFMVHLCHQYHIVAAITLVVVQIMTLASWNVAHVAMMSSSSSHNEQALPQEEQILTWWSWSQTILSNSKFASSMGGGAAGDDHVMNRAAGGMSDSIHASHHFHFGTSLILAEVCLVFQILWHWMSLLITAYRLKHYQRAAKRQDLPAHQPFGGDSRDVGLWFALQVVAEECRLWYHALMCR